MNPIITWTLRQRKKSTIAWCVGTALFIFINMIFYPTFKDQAAELQKSFESLPETAVQLFGGSTDFFSPIGFLNSQIYFIMLPLLLGVLAISLGHKLIASEEQDHTLELLLARPITRTRLLFAKASAGLIILAMVTVFTFLVTAVVAKIVHLEVPVTRIALATFVCFALAVSFASLAFMLSAMGRARTLSIGAAAAIAIGGYIISSLSGTVDWLQNPSKVFPFTYYKSEEILSGYMDWNNLLYFAGLIAGCAVISWLAFRRRDIG